MSKTQFWTWISLASGCVFVILWKIYFVNCDKYGYRVYITSA